MQDLDLCEPDLSQKVQLKNEWSRGVLLVDVGENMVPVGDIFEPDQVFAISLLD